MDISFYDFDFNLIAVFPRVISMNYTKKYCGFGTAELHFSINEKDLICMLENEPYLFFAAEGISAIVTGWKVDEDIAVFARTPEWLLTKRGVGPFVKSNTAPEQIVSEAVLAAAKDFIEIGDLYKTDTVQEYAINDVLVLYDVICDVLKPQSLGFKLVPDMNSKKFVFSVYSGNDTLCLFSSSARTAHNMTYTFDKQDMVTESGWYNCKLINMGNWDAVRNNPSLSNKNAKNAFKYYKITTSNSKFGLTCIAGEYIYCDSSDGVWQTSVECPKEIWRYYDGQNKEGAKKWDAVIGDAKTEAEALAKISSLKADKKVSGKTKSVQYGKDYSLGDIVSVQFEFGEFKKTEKKRITEVSFYRDVNEEGIEPVFDSLED